MTEVQAEIMKLKTKIELYHFSLSATKNSEHVVILRRAIKAAEARIAELEGSK